MNTFVLRPLYIVERILTEAGFEVTHAHDDLVFANHSKVLIQFGQVEKDLFLHIHESCEEEEQDQLFSQFHAIGAKHDVEVHPGRLFKIAESEQPNHVNIDFHD